MFNSRKNTQKPDGEFISRFQQAFADIVPRRESHHGQPENQFHYGAEEPTMPLRMAEDNDVKMTSHDVKFPVTGNNDRTPRNMQELGLTPSWMEPGSYSMMPFANQHHPGFYTPTSGGMGAIFHNQAGDLHTPTGMHLITPLSLSGLPAHNHNSNGFEPFHPQFINPMHDMNTFAQPQSFAPSAFMHRNTDYEAMEDSIDNTSVNDLHAETASNVTASTDFSSQLVGGDMSYAKGEKFRFNVSLRAPTAMVKHLSEVPITYLNKGQAYNLSVIDSSPPMVSHEPLRYRTFVRVSFEEPEQRSKPATCWQLWKEGRGINEAHQRGGKLLAVEYVDPFQGGADAHRHRQAQVESMSVDGFCVTWTANPSTGVSDCNIPVRFNFLSTDFSHSKGVKGIPVRLCAKTEIVSPGEDAGVSRDTELSYCKVKLFRDHGAERKLSNDIAHVKKSIDKLKQQVSQAETGGGFAKRKRGNNASATTKGTDRQMKPSHKRAWSMGSDDVPQEKNSLQDDLQSKLAMMQQMFTSTRSVSVFGLRGDKTDDPDLFPIRLSSDGESVQFHQMSRSGTRDLDSIMPSPPNTNTSSSNSPPSQATTLRHHPATIQRIPSGDKVSRGFLEAVGIDSSYRPPAQRTPKPIACFYVRFTGDSNPSHDYYRAIYLTERTARDFMRQLSEKCHIDAGLVSTIIHVNDNGLRVMVDDDVVRELPEGQDMIVDISELPDPNGSHTGLQRSLIEIKLTY